MIETQRDLDLRVTHRRELAATLERAAADEGARSVPITIATDAPVMGPRGFREILSHAPEAVDLSRAERGLPLQIAHQHGELPVGRVEDVRLDGSRLRGTARFSRSERGESAWRDVLDGILTDVSVGAIIRDDWEELTTGELLARHWQPVEVSLVSIGADPGAGINRGENMTEATSAARGGNAPPAPDRGEQIAALFQGLEGEQWLKLERDALRGSESIDVIRTRVMDRLKAAASQPVARDVPEARVSAGADAMEKWTAMCERALDHKLGLETVERRELADNELVGMSLREMAREYLRARGVSVAGMTPDRLVERALSVPSLVRSNFSHSSSDFANLLGSSAEKALASGYMEAPETYAAWTRNVSMSNFRQHTFTNLSLFGDLQQVREGEEYTAGTFSDRAETATLKTYGKLFSITRVAIVNDDLSAFTSIPMRMGRAAARQVGDLVYAIITADAVLSDQDGSTLFNTTDGNLASSGAAISTTTLSLARTALRTMTDPSGATLNIRPRYLIVPAALETTAQTVIRTTQVTGSDNNDINVFANSLDIVVEPRLDADSATQYYVFGAPGAEVDTVVVGWLDGRQTPYLESTEGFNVDGMQYKVRIDCTAAALDWRGMYSNPGA